MRKEFGEAIVKLATNDKRIWVVSMDLKSSLFLNEFANKFPDRFIEVGVAEQSGAGIAAGLAKTGKIVFLCSFACFSPAINWAVIRQSISYNKMPVKIIGSHAGLITGDLGATHQMLEDVALMRKMPNMEVVAPLNGEEIKKMVKVIAYSKKPTYVRLTRETYGTIDYKINNFTIGKSEILKSGKDVTIVGYGPILNLAVEAQGKTSKSLEIINCSSIKPFDEKTILKSITKTKKLIVIEDHQKMGGLGEGVASMILKSKINNIKFVHLGVDDKFGETEKDIGKIWNDYKIGIENLMEAIECMT